MIGYPITYGDSLEEGNGYTSEAIVKKTKEYWSDEENKLNFNLGYRHGLFVFGLFSIFLTSRAAFAANPEGVPGDNCPVEPGPSPDTGPKPGPSTPTGPKPGSLATVPTADRGAFGAGVLAICNIAMQTGAYWVGFVCAAGFIVAVSMANLARE